MIRFLCNTTTGKVVNSILLEPEAVYTPPDGQALVPTTVENVKVGGVYDEVTRVFTPPPVVVEEDPLADVKARYNLAATPAQKLDVLAEHFGIM